MPPGNLYIISAPSGAGKSTLIRILLENFSEHIMQLSVSHTTRSKRSEEIDGEHYYFVTPTVFQMMITRGEFIEYAQVFNAYYGTARHTVEKKLHQGIDLLLDIDWQGMRQVRAKIPQVCTIFVLPPSLQVLEERLYLRNQDEQSVIQQRMVQAAEEIEHYKEYDYLIINDDLHQAMEDLKSIVYANRMQCQQQQSRYRSLLYKLLAEKR